MSGALWQREKPLCVKHGAGAIGTISELPSKLGGLACASCMTEGTQPTSPIHLRQHHVDRLTKPSEHSRLALTYSRFTDRQLCD